MNSDKGNTIKDNKKAVGLELKEKVSMVIFIVLLGTFLTGILVAVKQYTSPIIEKNKAIKLKTSILDAFSLAWEKNNAEEIFSENIKVMESKGKTFYLTRGGDIAFGIAGIGLWGPIRGIIAIKSDLKTIKNITIIHQEETPGLGGRIAEREYLDTFKDKNTFPRLLIVSPGHAKKSNEVDGITGATMTSKAFEKLINDEIMKYIPLIRDGEEP